MEAYLEKAVKAAKAKTDTEFEAKFEYLRCNVDAYLTAEEKLAMEMVLRFPDWLQQEPSVLRENDAGKAYQLFFAGSCWFGACGNTAVTKSGTRTRLGVR